jgi:hypothetical protein
MTSSVGFGTCHGVVDVLIGIVDIVTAPKIGSEEIIHLSDRHGVCCVVYCCMHHMNVV